MFARVSIYDIPSGRVDEAVRSFGEALDGIAGARGFGEAFFLVSRDEGRALVLTTWNDHEAVTASRVTATRLRGEAVRAVDGDVVMVDEYELALRVAPRVD
jgi:heme-degrading monooxygenase HmoA